MRPLPGRFLLAPDLMKFAPVVMGREEPDPYDFEQFEKSAEQVARRLLPRLLPVYGGQLEELIIDYLAALRESGFVREAVGLCRPGYRAFFAARALETYSHGIEVREQRGPWDLNQIEYTAHMLVGARTPVGVTEPFDNIAKAVRTLLRVVEQRRRFKELSNEEKRAVSGAPIAVGRALFLELELPFSELPKASRARLAAGLLGSLAGIEETADAILSAQKSAAARTRRVSKGGG